ncbi:MAG: class I SAM-dependent methyltransferase [Proteobacteria bacterium]|nr:MAG: class I SAM-dependent methyltransferase [Pseudomonadota bacterium]
MVVLCGSREERGRATAPHRTASSETLVQPIEFDRHADTYSEKINRTLSAWGQEQEFYTRCKVPLLREALDAARTQRPLRVLDVGCGIGLIHPFLAPSVDELHGTDVSQQSIAIARRSNPSVHYRAQTEDALPYPDNSFDCAYAICVLHHVSPAQWPGFISEMARVVRPDGIVLIIEHNPLNPATQWVVRSCELDEGAVLLPPWTLRNLMAEAGIAALDVRHILFTPFDRPLFRKLDRLLARVPFGAQYVVSGRNSKAGNAGRHLCQNA